MDEEEVERRVRERISEIVDARSAKLKASYQQQALKAIQEAESRGYSKGRLEGGSGDSGNVPLPAADKESLEAAEQQGYERGKSKYLDLVKRSEDEAKRYKAIISMLPAIQYKDSDNVQSEDNKNILVKYLIEQVYRDSKKEFTEEEEVIQRFKCVLMKSNDSLVEKFKGYNLVDSSTLTASTPTNNNDDDNKTASGSTKTDPVVHSTRIRIPRSLRTFLSYTIPPMRHVISTSMPSFEVRKKTTKGVFIDGMEEIVVYEICSKIFRAVDIVSLYTELSSPSKQRNHGKNNNKEVLCFDFMSSHRYSEFKTLYNELSAEYPYCIIPPVPDVDMLLLKPEPLIEEGGSGIDKDNAMKNSKCKYRQLVLSHWIAHLVRHQTLQKSHILHSFLGRDLTNRESGRSSIKAYEPSASNNGNKRTIPNMQVWAPVLDLFDYPTTYTALSVDKVVQMRGCVEIALKDMNHLSDDIDSNQIALDSMATSVKELHSCMSSFLSKNAKMGDLLKRVSHQESSSCALLMGVDTLEWGYVGHSLANNCRCIGYGTSSSIEGETVETAGDGPDILMPLVHFNSTLSYFRHVNKAAKQSISSFKSTIASTRGDSLLGSMYDGLEGKEDREDSFSHDDDNHDTHIDNGMNTNENDMFSDLQRKKLLLSSQASKEWEICRRVRSAHTIEALQSLSTSMVSVYAQQTQNWLNCLEELDALDDSPAVGATGGTNGTGRRSSLSHMSVLSDVVQADGNALESRKCALNDHMSTVQHLQDIQRDVQSQLQAMAATGPGTAGVSSGANVAGDGEKQSEIKSGEGEMEHHNIARAIIPAGLRKQSQKVLDFFRSTLPFTAPPLSDTSNGNDNDGSVTPVGRSSAVGSKGQAEEHRGSPEPELFASSFGGAGSRMRGWSELSFEGLDGKTTSSNHDHHGTVDDSTDSNERGRERADTLQDNLFSSSQQDRLFDFEDDHTYHGNHDASDNDHENEGDTDELADTPMNRILKQKAREREAAQQREDEQSIQHKAVFSDNAMDFIHEKRRRGARGKTGRHAGGHKGGGPKGAGPVGVGVNMGDMGWGEAPKPAEARRPINHTQLAAQLAKEQFQQQEHMQWKEDPHSTGNAGSHSGSNINAHTSSNTSTTAGARKSTHTNTTSTYNNAHSKPPKRTVPIPDAPDPSMHTHAHTTTTSSNTDNTNNSSKTSHDSTGNDDSDGLPEGWQQVVNEDGSVYYYHKVDRISRWELPTREVAEAHASRHRAEEKAMSDKLQQRKAEFLQQQAAEQQENERKQDLQKSIQAKIKKWSCKANDKPKSIGVLLSTLHEICNFIDIKTIISGDKLNDTSNFGDVKKAYMKALRFIHPDKLPPSLALDQKLLAEATFIYLNEFYENYKTVMGV